MNIVTLSELETAYEETIKKLACASTTIVNGIPSIFAIANSNNLICSVEIDPFSIDVLFTISNDLTLIFVGGLLIDRYNQTHTIAPKHASSRDLNLLFQNQRLAKMMDPILKQFSAIPVKP